MSDRMFYTREMVDFLREKRTIYAIRELTMIFNARFGCHKTEKAIGGILLKNKILSGRDGRFKRGQKPWNYGTKNVCSANKTSFRCGNKPKNTRPLFSERINKDGVLEIKIKHPSVWIAKPRWVWETVHGPTPRGCIVRIRDPNKRGCSDISIDDVEMITRAENAQFNKMRVDDEPAAVRDTVKLSLRIKQQIKRIEAR